MACVFVRGHVPFDVEYVRRLRSMVKRHVSREHEFVCLTDRPAQMPKGVRPIRILAPVGMKGWWAKVELFKPGRFGGRVLYLDLDTLLVNSLDDVIDFPAEFALIPDGAPNFKGQDGLSVVKLFNSSVMVWDWDAVPDLYRQWTPAIARRLWGDQDWIGEKMPHAKTMPLDWFPRLSAVRNNWPDSAKVVLCKAPKNADAAIMWPWFEKAWS